MFRPHTRPVRAPPSPECPRSIVVSVRHSNRPVHFANARLSVSLPMTTNAPAILFLSYHRLLFLSHQHLRTHHLLPTHIFQFSSWSICSCLAAHPTELPTSPKMMKRWRSRSAQETICRNRCANRSFVQELGRIRENVGDSTSIRSCHRQQLRPYVVGIR